MTRKERFRQAAIDASVPNPGAAERSTIGRQNSKGTNGDDRKQAVPVDGVDLTQSSRSPIVVCMSDVEAKPIDWLWPGRIALGKLTGIAGNPGEGKSIFSLDLAARVSTAALWPDGSGRAPLGSVVLMSAEDDIEDTIRPCLDAAGADPAKIFALQGIQFRARDGKQLERAITLADVEAIESTVKRIADCRLIVMDPVTCFLGEADSHKNAEVRAALAPLVKLAGERKIAVVPITHLNKSNGAALYRTMGSLAFVAAARAAYVIARDKDDATGERRLFLPIKNNIGNDKTGLAYRVVADHTDRPHLVWEAGAVSVSADEALAVSTQSAEGDAGDRRRARTETKWTDVVLRVFDSLVVGSEDGTMGYSDVKQGTGLNATSMGHACFLLKEAGIIEVFDAECPMPNGGTKSRKLIRRLRGGSYKPGKVERDF